MTSAQPQAQPVTLTMPSDRELRIERVLNAPRDRVFAAYTDPALIPRWWGAETVVEEMDVRTGGSWRFVAHYPNGYDAAFSGTYREVTPPEKIVQTFSVEGMGTDPRRDDHIRGSRQAHPADGHLALRHHRAAGQHRRLRRGARRQRDLRTARGAPGQPGSVDSDFSKAELAGGRECGQSSGGIGPSQPSSLRA